LNLAKKITAQVNSQCKVGASHNKAAEPTRVSTPAQKSGMTGSAKTGYYTNGNAMKVEDVPLVPSRGSSGFNTNVTHSKNQEVPCDADDSDDEMIVIQPLTHNELTMATNGNSKRQQGNRERQPIDNRTKQPCTIDRSKRSSTDNCAINNERTRQHSNSSFVNPTKKPCTFDVTRQKDKAPSFYTGASLDKSKSRSASEPMSKHAINIQTPALATTSARSSNEMMINAETTEEPVDFVSKPFKRRTGAITTLESLMRPLPVTESTSAEKTEARLNPAQVHQGLSIDINPDSCIRDQSVTPVCRIMQSSMNGSPCNANADKVIHRSNQTQAPLVNVTHVSSVMQHRADSPKTSNLVNDESGKKDRITKENKRNEFQKQKSEIAQAHLDWCNSNANEFNQPMEQIPAPPSNVDRVPADVQRRIDLLKDIDFLNDEDELKEGIAAIEEVERRDEIEGHTRQIGQALDTPYDVNSNSNRISTQLSNARYDLANEQRRIDLLKDIDFMNDEDELKEGIAAIEEMARSSVIEENCRRISQTLNDPINVNVDNLQVPPPHENANHATFDERRRTELLREIDFLNDEDEMREGIAAIEEAKWRNEIEEHRRMFDQALDNPYDANVDNFILRGYQVPEQHGNANHATFDEQRRIDLLRNIDFLNDEDELRESIIAIEEMERRNKIEEKKTRVEVLLL